MATKIFLGVSTAVWLPYGLFCFFRPDFLAEAAGVAATSATATVELRAMYGGLEFAIGLLAALGLARAALERPALIALAFACAGLGISRLLGAAIESESSAYTVSALVFELASAAAALWLLRRQSNAALA